MKPSRSILHVIFFAGLLLSGCGNLREAILGRQNPLAPPDNVGLGHTSQVEILQRFGNPDEINERRFDTHGAEIFYYYDQDESGDNREGYPELKILACEFKKGILNGYVFQKFGRSRTEDFDDSGRTKLVKGRTTRRETEEILGAPNGRSLLPTTLVLPALAAQVGGVPTVFSAIPENAREAWFYNSQSFEDGQRQPRQRSLIVFFDDKGIYLGSTGLQQLVSKLP